VLKNVVRGFSLVLHDPEGSHYEICRVKASKTPEFEREKKVREPQVREGG
jgi:hypothetical protein